MSRKSKSRVVRRLLLASALLLAGGVSAAQCEELPAELEKLKVALEKYKDPVVAVRDGYFSTLGCVEYENGGMGGSTS